MSADNAVRVPPDALAALVLLVKAGRHGDLETRARELLVRHPNSGVLTKLLAAALWAQGKDALPYLERTVELLPDDGEAHSNLGNALRAAGQFESAVKSHRRAVAVRPEYAEAHNNLGSALLDLSRLDEAISSFRRAIAIKPDFALAHSNLGNALMLHNQPDLAESSCRRALEIDSRQTAAIVQIAEIQAARGRFDEARETLRQAIAAEPDMPEAWSALVRSRKMTISDTEWLAQAERIVLQPLAPRREVHLRYALGKYFDDVADYGRAFAHYRRANELAACGRPAHDRGRVSAGIDRLIRTYDQEWVDRVRVDANPSARPVFIVGMPRSGTTLAEQILAAHGAVFGAGELPFWNAAAARYVAARGGGEAAREGGGSTREGGGAARDGGEVARDGGEAARGGGGHESAERALLATLADDYLTVLRSLSADALRVVDKMPGNFLYLGVLHAALPQARIFHMRRNPIDTCLSIYFQNFDAAHSYANDLEDLAHYYGEYLRIMDHWRRVLPPGAMLEVTYEALVEDPETWSRRMVEFIGLPWDANCLEFHRSTRPVSTFSKWQARQKISASSIGRWRHYERFLGPLLTLISGREPPSDGRECVADAHDRVVDGREWADGRDCATANLHCSGRP